MQTPYTEAGLRQYDQLPVLTAIKQAWTNPGPNSGWHLQAQSEVRSAMPVLARMLDRLTSETAVDVPSSP
jgi:hypothetical protein